MDDLEQRVLAEAIYLDKFEEKEGADVEVDLEKTFSKYVLVRDGLKEDARGRELLSALISGALAYFKTIDSYYQMLASPRINPAHADMVRRITHDSFIGKLVDLETYLSATYGNSLVGQGVYALDTKDLLKPYEKLERGNIRAWGYALLRGIGKNTGAGQKT